MSARDRVHCLRGLLGAIVVLAFGLRLYRLGADSLWYDETVSVRLAGESIPGLIAHTARDIHPPGYYLLLHTWGRLAGLAEFSAGFLSAFFGILLVVLAYRLGAKVFGRRAALLAALLVAVSPFNLWYSQEVRMYSLAAVLGMSLLLIVVDIIGPTRRVSPSWRQVVAYGLLGAAGLWVLYYFAFLLVAVNLMIAAWWVVNWRRGRAGWMWLLRWLAAQALVLLFYVPWLPVAWRQATSPPVPPWRGYTPLGSVLLESWTALSLGQSANLRWAWPLLLLTGLLSALGLFYGVQGRRRTAADQGEQATTPGLTLLLAGYVLLPVLLIYLASFASPLYHVRYVFTYSTALYIILGAGLCALGRWWRPASWLALVTVLAFSLVTVSAWHSKPRFAPDDHRQAARFLAERWRPGDAILVDAGYAYTALLTYWDGNALAWRGRLAGDTYPATSLADVSGPVVFEAGTVGGDPSLGWGDPGSDFYAMSESDTAAALAQLFEDFDRVWVYRIYDTITDPGGFIRRWLDDHARPFEDQVFSGEAQLRVQGFVGDQVPVSGPAVSLEAGLANGTLRLLGVDPWAKEVEVGAALDLSPVWRVEAGPLGELLLFGGLFDAEGRRWAQTDERPLGSLLPVASWPEGATFRTPLRVGIPAGTPPGTYQLELGWYRFEDGQPFWVPWTGGERLVLGTVDVIAPEDWWLVPPPTQLLPIGVTVGPGIRFLGFRAASLEAYPGASLDLDLVWQAVEDSPAPAPGVLQLVDSDGNVVSEDRSAPVGGRMPFKALSSGQVVRDPRSLPVPAELQPGIYDLRLGRMDAKDEWLAIRRGLAPLGSTYPLASIRVLSR